MINFKIDVSGAVAGIEHRLAIIKNGEFVRTAALDLVNMMSERIHEKGKAADGGPIGTYSPEYMKVRTGNFGNSGRFKKGKNQGKAKDSGLYSRGENKGKARPKYNRSNDPKIVVSLTRQLENDYTVVATPRGWGVGFNNPINYQKARWVEENKRKIIFATTKEEREYVINRMRAGIRNILNQ